MNPRDIISVQIEFAFGYNYQSLLKKLVNAALDEGEWHDDFDIAVTRTELDNEEATKLLQSVLRAYQHYAIDVDILKALIDKHLPAAELTQIHWLIGPDLALIFTDFLRVAKIEYTTLVWVTKRVSYDGILLDRVENNVLLGSWYDVTRSSGKWQPLRLSYIDGSLLEGEEV